MKKPPSLNPIISTLFHNPSITKSYQFCSSHLQKSFNQMELQDWELLPYDEFLDINDGGKIFSGKYETDPKSVFKMNYFEYPSPKSQNIIIDSIEDSTVPKNKLVPTPIQLEPTIVNNQDHEVEKKMPQVPTDIGIAPSPNYEKIKAPNIGSGEGDQLDYVSQVFFKKTKDAEFVDMKMDSPKLSSRGIMPQINEAFENNNCLGKIDFGKEMVTKNKEMDSDIKEEVSWEEGNGGLNTWKWGLTGIGVAATICIIFFGSGQKNRKHQQNQKLRFETYSNEKRMKQVVHHATKLNEAISAVRGGPLTRAHITYGGYYDGL